MMSNDVLCTIFFCVSTQGWPYHCRLSASGSHVLDSEPTSWVCLDHARFVHVGSPFDEPDGGGGGRSGQVRKGAPGIKLLP